MKSNILNFTLQFDWLTVFTNLATISTFFVALLALNVWRQQEKTKRTLDYFDELTDAIHEFVNLIRVPTQRLEFILISIENRQYDRELNKSLNYPEAIRFIEKEGNEQSKKLFTDLNMCSASVFRINSLMTKGQLMNIKYFNDCYNACSMIIWQYERIQAFATMLSINNANWENVEIIKRLGEVLEIKPDDINAHLNKNQKLYLKYLKSIYIKEYGNA